MQQEDAEVLRQGAIRYMRPQMRDEDAADQNRQVPEGTDAASRNGHAPSNEDAASRDAAPEADEGRP